MKICHRVIDRETPRPCRFIARRLASREEAKRTGVTIEADVVHAELAKKLAQARARLQEKARG
jgi:hypothetical protein